MKLFRDAIWTFLGNAGARLISGVFTIAIARFVGVEHYGIFVLALTVSAIAAQFADFGLQQTYIKAVSANPDDANHLIAGAFWLRLILSILTSLLLFFGVRIFVEPDYFSSVIAMAIPLVIGMSLFNMGQGVELGLHRMRAAAIGRILNTVLIVGCSTIPLYFWPPSIDLSLAVSLAYGIGSLISGFIYIRVLSASSVFSRNAIRAARSLFDSATGFFWSGLLYVVTPQLPILLLQGFAGSTLLGVFALAYRLPLVLYMLPGSIGQSFYPKLFKAAATRTGYDYLIKVEAVCVVALGAALALTLDLFSPWIAFALVKDVAHIESVAIYLAWLSWLLLFQSLTQPFSHILMTSGYQGARAYIQGGVFLTALFSYYFVVKDGNILMLCWLMLALELINFSACSVYLYFTARRSVMRDLIFMVLPFLFLAGAAKIFIYFTELKEGLRIWSALTFSCGYMLFIFLIAGRLVKIEAKKSRL